ncbi:MAG: glycosyltransferase, partial [Bacteroidia bacterium]
MHIAVLCDPASFHTQKWAQALQRNGAEVTVFSFSKEKVEGVNCVQIKPWGGRLSYAAFLRSGKTLRAALEAHKVDVLNPINITPYGVLAARSGFRPIAAVSMGADILEYPPSRKAAPGVAWMQTNPPGLFGKLTNRLRHRYFRKLVKEALDAASFVTGDNLVLVHAVRDWFDIPEGKLQLNRWGAEPALFDVSEADKQSLREQFGIEEGQAVVLSPRGMKPIYQGELILEAYERLLNEGRKEKFIMLSAGYAISKAA